MATTCDEKCYELAVHFLSDAPELEATGQLDNLAGALALEIQQLIEDEIDFMIAALKLAPRKLA